MTGGLIYNDSLKISLENHAVTAWTLTAYGLTGNLVSPHWHCGDGMKPSRLKEVI
jgi:hypothetical protein